MNVDKARKEAVKLVRVLVKVRGLLGRHVTDMEDAELTDEELYTETCDVMADVEAQLAAVDE
jgi:hypothetical protein